MTWGIVGGLQWTPYTLPIAATGVFMLGFAGYVHRAGSTRESRGTEIATALMLVGAAWLFTYLVTLSATDLATKRLVKRVEFVFAGMLPAAWFVYVLWYTRRDAWFDRRTFGLLAAGYVVAVGPVVTNPYHNLVWTGSHLERLGSFVVLRHDLQVGFLLFFTYTYGLLFASTVLLGSAFVQSRGVLRWQAGGLLVFSLVPGIAGLVDIVGLNPTPGLNVAALSVIVTAVAGAVSALEFRWFDLSPVGRDRLVEAIDEPVLVVDDEGRIVDCNPAAAVLAEDEGVGRPLSSVVPELACVDDDERELAIETSDGRRYVDVGVAPLDDAGDDARIYVLRDVTERVRARESLERERDRLDEFASVVSHDLRNPLSVASGRIDLERERRDSEHLAAASDAHDRMERMIDDLLALARQGRTVGDTEPTEVAAVAREAWANVATDEANLVVETTTTVDADPERLREALENLFRNAVEHAGPDVTVTVGDLGSEGFYVADDGPGIPPEKRDRVLESGYTTADDGTGFGLAIVERVAEAHDWTLSVEESDDGGARFAFDTD